MPRSLKKEVWRTSTVDVVVKMNALLFVVIALATLAPLQTDAQTELNIPDNLGKRFVIGFGPNLSGEDW